MGDTKVRLLYSRTNVFIQFNDDVCVPGVMCIIEQSPDTYVFSWISEDKISPEEMDLYKKVENSKEIILPNCNSENSIYVQYSSLVSLNSISASLSEIESFATTYPTEWYIGIIVKLKNEIFLPTFYIQKRQFEQDEEFYAELSSCFTLLGKTIYKTNLTGQQVFKIYDDDTGIPSSSIPVNTNEESEFVKSIKEAKFNVLFQFSKVTRMGKEAAAHLLGHSVAKPLVPLLPKSFVYSILSKEEVQKICSEFDAAKEYLTNIGKDMQEKTIYTINQTIKNNSNYQRLNDKNDEWDEDSLINKIVQEINEKEKSELERKNNPSTSNEDNDIQLTEMPEFVSHRTGYPISAEQWISFYDDEGRLIKTEEELRTIIYNSGLENDIRVDAWKYLLNIYSWNSTEKERNELNKTLSESYYNLKSQWKGILEKGPMSADSIDDEVKNDYNAGDERFESNIYKRISERKYRIEKDVLRTDRTIPMYSNDTNNDSYDRPEIYENIEVDTSQAGWNSNLELLRDILVTYTFLENNNGYVQGMSDLLTPILGVTRNESDAFWCFNEFMERNKGNFDRDQAEMKKQLSLLTDLIRMMNLDLYLHFEKLNCLHLFFCFRWLLIIFKREFDFIDCMRIWETMWAQTYSDYYQHFIALAILNKNQEQLLECQSFDDLLKYINDLSLNLQVEPILMDAEILYNRFVYRLQEVESKIIEEKVKFLKNDKENGIVHMENMDANTNTDDELIDIAKKELKDDKDSYINRLKELFKKVKKID